MAVVMHPIISSIQKIALYETKSVSNVFSIRKLVLFLVGKIFLVLGSSHLAAYN